MAKLDARKATVSFLTNMLTAIVAVIIIAVVNLIIMIQNQSFDILFWAVAVFVFALLLSCIVILNNIQKNIKELEKL